MAFKLDGREFHFGRIEIRIPGPDGLTDMERVPIDKIAQKFGYSDITDLAKNNGFQNPREMAYSHSFKNCRDFFLGKGWPDRLGPYNRNGINRVSEADLLAVDPDYLIKNKIKNQVYRSRIEKTNEED